MSDAEFKGFEDVIFQPPTKTKNAVKTPLTFTASASEQVTTPSLKLEQHMEIKDVYFNYGHDFSVNDERNPVVVARGDKSKKWALRDINLRFSRGEYICIMVSTVWHCQFGCMRTQSYGKRSSHFRSTLICHHLYVLVSTGTQWVWEIYPPLAAHALPAMLTG